MPCLFRYFDGHDIDDGTYGPFRWDGPRTRFPIQLIRILLGTYIVVVLLLLLLCFIFLLQRTMCLVAVVGVNWKGESDQLLDSLEQMLVGRISNTHGYPDPFHFVWNDLTWLDPWSVNSVVVVVVLVLVVDGLRGRGRGTQMFKELRS